MSIADNLLAFTFAATLLTLTPGLDTALVLRTATVEGKRQALQATLGINAGCLLWGAAVAFGLGALIAVSEVAFNLLKYCGAAYLAWLGLRMLRSRGGSLSAPQGESGTGGYSARSVLLKSFLVAVTNPKGYLFCSALLPQFIDPAAAQAPQYIAIALVFALIDFLVMLAYAFAGSRAARLLRGQAALWLDRLCGGMLLALAGSLAFYRRATN